MSGHSDPAHARKLQRETIIPSLPPIPPGSSPGARDRMSIMPVPSVTRDTPAKTVSNIMPVRQQLGARDATANSFQPRPARASGIMQMRLTEPGSYYASATDSSSLTPVRPTLGQQEALRGIPPPPPAWTPALTCTGSAVRHASRGVHQASTEPLIRYLAMCRSWLPNRMTVSRICR